MLFARAPAGAARVSEPDLFADDDDMTSAGSRPVTLEEHSKLVERTVEKLVRLCLPEELIEPMRLAAYWHDVGKLDERFQLLLHHGDELAVACADAALAKSSWVPTPPARRRAIWEATGLPRNFRHEVVSLPLLELCAPLPADPDRADLARHLVASHHGHARPFCPISDDPDSPPIAGHLGAREIVVSREQRLALVPLHRFDSGVAERFWELVRRYSWWGLAYLEAILRLGDWYASRLAVGDGR